MIADMRNLLLPEDRLDQKLTLVCSDGRSIEGDFNLWLLTRLAGFDYVCQISSHSFCSSLSHHFVGREVDPAAEFQPLSGSYAVTDGKASLM